MQPLLYSCDDTISIIQPTVTMKYLYGMHNYTFIIKYIPVYMTELPTCHFIHYYRVVYIAQVALLQCFIYYIQYK